VITVDFERLTIEPGFRMLDVGCGSGRHTCAASQFDKVVAIGSDINFEDVVEAKNRLIYQESLGEHGGGLSGIMVSDIRCLPFEDNYFDLVICSEVLEHIDDHKKAISELIRVLKQGKDLVVSVPRYFPERICWALSRDYHQADNGHIRIYRKKKLIALLEAAGVNKWAVHFAHSLHSPYWWLKCLVGPDRENSAPVNLYHQFLVWDMMKQPWITSTLDRLLNPILGKSLVLYLRKQNA
jgi:ubiquinone/menaquinone biosynthesis C-methylase UbiE